MNHELGPAPKRCPNCKSRDLETGRMPDDDDYDEDLAATFGVPENEHDSRFSFIYEVAVCEDCHTGISYGRRYYWNEATGDYDLPAPGSEPPLNDPSLYVAPLL